MNLDNFTSKVYHFFTKSTIKKIETETGIGKIIEKKIKFILEELKKEQGVKTTLALGFDSPNSI